MITAQDLAAMAKTQYESFNARTFDKNVALCDENIVLNNVAFGTTLNGHAGVREWLTNWSTALPDAKVEVVSVSAGDTSVATEFIGRGTHNGPFAGPMGTIPATGRPIEIRFCEVFKVRNGKFVEQHIYFDAATLMRQLGLMA